jgi:hypothetical protein
MRIMTDASEALYPHSYIKLTHALCDLPTNTNVSSSIGSGNNCDFHNSILKATGEYLERHYFYHEINSQQRGILKFDNKDLYQSFKTLFYAINNSFNAWHKHKWHLSEFKNIFTTQSIALPTALVSLANNLATDRQYIPYIDSCGQAVHNSTEKSLHAALTEFLERQALIRTWLSKNAVLQITMDQLPNDNLGNLMHRLQAAGELYIFNISADLPGYVILSLYFSNDIRDNVQYSIGLSADFNPYTALYNSIIELWQTYNYIYINTEQQEHMGDKYRYLSNLLDFNLYNTKKLFNFCINSDINTIKLSQFLQHLSFNYYKTLQYLQKISNFIFYYQHTASFMGTQLHFTKIISPDFYLHMNLPNHCNGNNKYARIHGIDSLDLANISAIPFP